MEKGYLAIILFPFMALAVDCRELVATAFGFEKPTTVALSEKGRVLHIEDTLASTFGFSPDIRFAVTERDSHVGKLNALKSFSAKPLANADEAFLLIVDDTGIPQFVIPGLGPLPLLLPGKVAVTAAAMHTTSVRDVQLKTSQMESAPYWDDVKSMAEGMPLRLYFATDDGIYFSTVRTLSLSEVDPQIKAGIEGKNLVRSIPPHPAIAEIVSTETVRPLRDRVIDFHGDIPDTTLWAPLPSNGRAVQFTQFAKIATFPKDFPVKEIDFLSVLTPNHLLVASEGGKMVIWDIKEKKIHRELSFAKPGWLGSVSGHELGGEFHVWAINSGDNQIYRWSSTDSENFLSAVPRALPNGVVPLQIVTAGEALARRDSNQLQQAGALSSNHMATEGEIFSERVLVLGNDDKIYGRTAVQIGYEVDYFWLTDDDARVQTVQTQSP